MTAAAQQVWWRPRRPADLDGLLWHRRWWRHTWPFPHVRAVNVFVPEVYQALVEDFRQWQQSTGGGVRLRGHDLSGATVTRSWTGPLSLFASRGWCDLVAGATGATGLTRHVNVGLHRHEPHSSPGFPHTDLNPGWFPRAAGDAIVLADPHRVEYTTGSTRGEHTRAVPVVRAVAVLFYLANPRWRADHDGRTGLYRSGRDDPAEPAESVPPHSNSLLAFECTPWSFHGFTGGGSVPRNSVVQWLHRSQEAVEARWGPEVVVGYGEAER